MPKVWHPAKLSAAHDGGLRAMGRVGRTAEVGDGNHEILDDGAVRASGHAQPSSSPPFFLRCSRGCSSSRLPSLFLLLVFSLQWRLSPPSRGQIVAWARKLDISCSSPSLAPVPSPSLAKSSSGPEIRDFGEQAERGGFAGYGEIGGTGKTGRVKSGCRLVWGQAKHR